MAIGAVTGERSIDRLSRVLNATLLMQLLIRLAYAAALVFGTYNPAGVSYWAWLRRGDVDWVWRLAATGILAVVHAATLRPAIRALGLGGLAFAFLFASASAWVMMDLGWLAINDARSQVWFLLSVAALLIGVGLWWVKLVGALDGQIRAVELN